MRMAIAWVVQELYDVNDPGVGGQDQGGTAPDAWRQARIDLSPFAGQQDLRLRFEFATGGTFNTADPLRGGVEITAVPAWQISDGQFDHDQFHGHDARCDASA